MDETMKHRVIGITVIISIAAIFVPAMLKKNSQRIEEREIAIHLPPQPKQVSMDRVDEEKEFRSIKVAHVTLPTVDSQRSDAEYEQAVRIGKPELLHSNSPEQVAQSKPSIIASADDVALTNKPTVSPNTHRPRVKVKPKKVYKPNTPNRVIDKPPAPNRVIRKPAKRAAASSAPRYVVQVGVFSKEDNAKHLLTLLKNNGIEGKKRTLKKGQALVYKITAGNSDNKAQMQYLQRVILSQVHIKGIIVQDKG